MKLRKDFFEIFLKNWERQNELDALLTDPSVEINDSVLHNRSVELKKMFNENNEMIQELEEKLRNVSACPLTKEENQFLYEGLLSLYYEDCDDLHLAGLLLNYLINHYETTDEISRLVILYAVRLYYNVEILFRLTGKCNQDMLIGDFRKVVGFTSEYSRLTTEARRKIYVAYYNYCVVYVDLEIISVNSSCQTIKEMMALWNSDIAQSLDKDDEGIKDIPDRCIKEWLEFYRFLDDATPETMEFFHEMTEKVYSSEKEKGKEDYEISYETYGGHVASMTLKNEISPLEGFRLLRDYYEKRRDFLKHNHEDNSSKLVTMSFEYMDYLYFYTNTPQILVEWINKYHIPYEDYLPIGKLILKDIHIMWKELYDNLPASFMDWFIIKVCLMVISLESDVNAQLEWLEKFLVKRDIPTYIHSSMVADLAKLIAEDIMEYEPEIFVGTWGYTLHDVIQNKEAILNFITLSAKFHDIGKTRIGVVINTQTRKIDDYEFKIIKTHPSEGAGLLAKVPILRKFSDVIIGHHKSYDGLSGYPASFDNTKSEVRTVIDLITICDCLDAATDNLGRNYSTAKTAKTVIGEIYHGRGTRYNPRLAEYLVASDELVRRIEDLTTTKRVEKYRTILRKMD